MSLAQLRQDGVVLLRSVFSTRMLANFRMAADACFEALESGERQANEASAEQRYRFHQTSHSVILPALLDFGWRSSRELMEPVTEAGLEGLLSAAMDGEVRCDLEQSWIRKRFAPALAPRQYRPNSWHQDGGLGVRFGAEPGPPLPMTRVMTCWIPLQACGRDSPGLEFVRRRLDTLLHYTELTDLNISRRFGSEFWAPEMDLGDGLLIMPGSLHRTYVRPEMRQNRVSVEYRFFMAAESR